MSSEEIDASGVPTSSQNSKANRKPENISMDSPHHCIASAMAKVINTMVNKELQQRCKELLEMEDLAETEARILFILEQIDKEREEEIAKKENRKRRRMRKD